MGLRKSKLLYYINFVWEFSRTHFATKYKNSNLYFLWHIINPLILFGVLYVIFSKNLGANIPYYPLFVLIGVVHWNFFNIGTSYGTATFSYYANIVKKTNTNRFLMLLSIIFSCFYSHLIELCILLCIAGFIVGLSWTLFMMLIVLLLEILLILGLSLLISSIASYVVDIESVWKNIIFFGWFLTPIIYSQNSIPSKLSFIIKINPEVYIIDFSRDIIINKQLPPSIPLLLFSVAIIIFFILSYWIFSKLIKNIAERI